MTNISLGLDIGINSIKAVQLSKEKNNRTLIAAGFIPTPVSQISTVSDSNEQLIVKSIIQLIHDMKISSVNITASLPSAKVTTQIIEVPAMNDKELASSIHWEAEQYIPLPLSKVKIDYAVLGKNEYTQKMKILLVAAPITLIEKYMKIINSAGLNLVSLETEIIAQARSITENYPTLKNIIIMTMGATNCEIGIIHDQYLIFNKTIPIGGNTLTRAIADELGFELTQAEEYKKTYGLEEDKLEGKIYKTLMPFFVNIYSDMEKTIAYFKEQYPKDEISTVILCGGGAKLPGLLISMTKYISISSQINNPFLNISLNKNVLPILTADAPTYSTAVGLALKDI